MDNIVEADTAEESDIDSDEDENIVCKSPQKSPVKKQSSSSSGLLGKRRLSESGPSHSLSESEDVSEDHEDDDEEESDVVEQSRAGHSKPSEFQFKEPTFRKKQFIFHPFKQSTDGSLVPDTSSSPVTVTIPEQLAASYGLYIWPSAPVLAWYLWLNQDKFKNQNILELGAGTALPGILLAKVNIEELKYNVSCKIWILNF